MMRNEEMMDVVILALKVVVVLIEVAIIVAEAMRR